MDRTIYTTKAATAQDRGGFFDSDQGNYSALGLPFKP
jgi:hypothetical protein